ncbi:MAG: methyl-accepting chemotaxis protein [Thermodesulfobacteriota bacterium]|nr:MAG: methyl-accepting chemotaxis protein [Thermodesulfobacteriota bacterium]
MSIKFFLTGVIGLLVLFLIGISAGNVWDSYKKATAVKQLEKANRLSDHILRASGYQAKERGITAIFLAPEAVMDDTTFMKLKEIRSAGDEAFNNAQSLAKELFEHDPSNLLLKTAMERASGSFSGLHEMRKSVDGNLMNPTKTLTATSWIGSMTRLIDDCAELRLAPFMSSKNSETLHDALRMNIEIKQAVWLVSEYAGRERATMGSFVSSRRPVEPAALERLNTFRAVVEINIIPILRLKETAGIDPAVLRAVTEMEKVFLSAFGEVRSGVYAATSTGNYPVTGKEWVEKSSEGIDSILHVSDAIGKMVSSKLDSELRRYEKSILLDSALLAAVAAICLISVIFITRKVIGPMNYLKEAMSEIERTGNISLKLKVDSRDECGQMAETFNRMMGHIHAIIKDINGSVEQLASSSEELNGSAQQISSGATEQASSIEETSTAMEQMASNIRQNTTNASETEAIAIKSASDALKSGKAVAETVSAMKDIATRISIIEEIARQTNLLALNAAIEAARAGEHGKGFAVVASEVRKLAERSQAAAGEIGKLSTASVHTAEETGEMLATLVPDIQKTADLVKEITSASNEQSAGADQINKAIQELDHIIQQNASGAEELSATSEELAAQAARLQSAIAYFKLEDKKAGAGPTSRKSHAPLRVAQLKKPEAVNGAPGAGIRVQEAY